MVQKRIDRHVYTSYTNRLYDKAVFAKLNLEH